jgi:hypothetical protein
MRGLSGDAGRVLLALRVPLLFSLIDPASIHTLPIDAIRHMHGYEPGTGPEVAAKTGHTAGTTPSRMLACSPAVPRFSG